MARVGRALVNVSVAILSLPARHALALVRVCRNALDLRTWRIQGRTVSNDAGCPARRQGPNHLAFVHSLDAFLLRQALAVAIGVDRHSRRRTGPAANALADRHARPFAVNYTRYLGARVRIFRSDSSPNS